jgi:tetratricopeptide (TPR) repeat protein
MLDPATADVLRLAVDTARRGRTGEALKLAEGALARGGDPVALNAFLGMLRARDGDREGAISHLRAAHAGNPADTTIACNLIATLIETSDTAAALAVATRELAMADPSLRIARYRGFLAQSLGDFAEAVEAYEHVVAQAPGDFESWNNLGNARQGTGDVAGSVTALERAVALDPGALPTRLNLATALQAAARDDGAETALRAAADLFPANAEPLHSLYVQYKRLGRQEEALAAIEGAISRDSGSAGMWLKAAIEFGLVHRLKDAEQAFRRCLEIDPQETDAYLGLAVQYEHTNRDGEFAPLIELAEANGLDAGPTGFLRALEHRRAGRYAEGLECLARVPDDIEPPRTAHLRATLLDRLGRSDEAFAAFEATARLHQEGPADPLPRAAKLREEVRSEVALMTPAWATGWNPGNPPAERPDPVFLVGFPRSGTTLLDTILMGHPGTVVMEEQPPLNLVDLALGGMATLPALGEADIIAARARYFKEVAKLADVPPGKLLIDKSPLFLSKAPLIRRLFPEARFILALRHPCDVLLSCFMSNFRLNSAMANFLRLEDAAEFYDLTFRHWERSRELWPLQVHTIVYERLVEDVSAQVRPLFDYLGLDWHEAALDHQSTARARGLVTTASYAQITEPIYSRAAGRWQRYRRHLEPVLPVLAPWAAKFGYEL